MSTGYSMASGGVQGIYVPEGAVLPEGTTKDIPVHPRSHGLIYL